MANIKSITRSHLFPSLTVPRDVIFSYPSRLIDRAVDYIEEILLPEAKTQEGRLEIELSDQPTVSNNRDPAGLKKRAMAYIPGAEISKPLLLEDRVTIDLRYRFPGNWAHALTNHLPLASLIANLLDLEAKDITLIFPKNISPQILLIFNLCGYPTINTDRPVVSRNCRYNLSPWISIRGGRTSIIRDCLNSEALFKKIHVPENTLRKIFISRRSTRTVINEEDVEKYLTNLGFVKVYMEDYSGLEQLSLIFHAQSIVAVHGAALGPQIFRVLSGQPYQLLEIFSPAHITDVYRVISHQTNGQWCGIRGKVWPELVRDKANFSNNLKNFEVSLDSLDYAMKKLSIS